MIDDLVIPLSWPIMTSLTSNKTSGRSWRATSAIKKQCKMIGGQVVAEYFRFNLPIINPRDIESIRIEVVFNQLRYDLDNLVASTKHYQDGVFKALGLSDNAIREAHYRVVASEAMTTDYTVFIAYKPCGYKRRSNKGDF